MHLREVAPDDAREFASWRYPEPYSLYDASGEDADTYLDATFLAIDDDDGSLVAHGCFGVEARVPGGKYEDDAIDVGAGMRPDLTGQGRGRLLLEALFDEAVRRFGERPLRVTIAAFNERALHLVRKLGFQEVELFRNPAGREFVVLIRR